MRASQLAWLALPALCACSSETLNPDHGATPTSQKPLAYTSDALAGDGPAPPITAQGVCGSDMVTFLAELLSGDPSSAKVQYEWGDIEGGKQLAMSGVVKTAHLGPTDEPMSHQAGWDLSMNIALDPGFGAFAHSLGKSQSESGANGIHVEISEGYIPHLPVAPGPATGETWEQAATANQGVAQPGIDPHDFQPGFDQPAVGAPMLMQGRYIIDCGHDDYSTELHPLSFVAFAEAGAATVVRAYYNPYRDTELYNPDFNQIGQVADQGRLSASTTLPFPKNFVQEVARLIAGATDHLRSFGLIDAQAAPPPDFVVCAPAGTGGTTLKIDYDFVTRSGVSLSFSPSYQDGCVAVHTEVGADYGPLAVTARLCQLPWTYLDKIAGEQIGNPNLDIRQAIINKVGQQYADKFNMDPVIGCIDAMAGPAVSPAPSGQSVRVDDSQPFPFYGVLAVTWTNE